MGEKSLRKTVSFDSGKWTSAKMSTLLTFSYGVYSRAHLGLAPITLASRG